MHMGHAGAASSFSPRGEVGPKGRMRGRGKTQFYLSLVLKILVATLLVPLICPLGIFSPLGRRGGRTIETL